MKKLVFFSICIVLLCWSKAITQNAGAEQKNIPDGQKEDKKIFLSIKHLSKNGNCNEPKYKGNLIIFCYISDHWKITSEGNQIKIAELQEYLLKKAFAGRNHSKDELSDYTVVVQANGGVPYNLIEKVLSLCARVRIPKIHIELDGNSSQITEKELKDLISKLGNDDWETREKATEELINIGEAARSLLRDALKNNDPEIQMRASLILKNIICGNMDIYLPYNTDAKYYTYIDRIEIKAVANPKELKEIDEEFSDQEPFRGPRLDEVRIRLIYDTSYMLNTKLVMKKYGSEAVRIADWNSLFTKLKNYCDEFNKADFKMPIIIDPESKIPLQCIIHAYHICRDAGFDVQDDICFAAKSPPTEPIK